MTQLAFVDTETLGLDERIHPIWEIAVVLHTPVGDGQVEVTEHAWQLLVSEHDISRADPKALEITRFHERYDASMALGVLMTIDLLVELLEPGCILVGNVVSFDEERLRRLFRIAGHPWPWHYHLVDVESVAAGALGIEPPWESEKLSAALGIVPPEGEDRHSALADARWAQKMYAAAMRPRSRSSADRAASS